MIVRSVSFTMGNMIVVHTPFTADRLGSGVGVGTICSHDAAPDGQHERMGGWPWRRAV